MGQIDEQIHFDRKSSQTRDREADAGRSMSGVSSRALRKSFRYCHRVTRQRARNFYYGLKLMPREKRAAMYAIYAFMRTCDDMADGDTGNGDPQAALQRIEQFRQTMEYVINQPADAALPEGELWPAFYQVVHQYHIETQYLHAMLDGQREDLTRRSCQTFDQLYDYCYKVASTVGLVCLSVWGWDGDPQVKKLAEYRGIAFQLTNILRNLTEDVSRGRVYLPREDLERFGYYEDDLRHQRQGPAFDRLMRYQIERARSYYDMSASLERHLTPECRPTSLAMTRIYRGILERIAEQPERVLEGRVRLSKWMKLQIASSALRRRNER